MTTVGTLGQKMTEGSFVVPSGQDITLLEVVMDDTGPQGLTARFRFLAPAISRDGGTIGFDVASLDMEALCRSVAIPALAKSGGAPAQVIIALSDRPVPFGESDPEATQYFEAYKLVGDDCIWEAF